MDSAEHLTEGLSESQHKAVTHERGPLLILAGPGSGKTRVICHRIAWLIVTGRAEARSILGVTFTNKAAGEMRSRVMALLGNSAAGIQLTTFHSLCARLLRTYGESIGLAQEYVIYDRDDQLKAAREALNAPAARGGVAMTQADQLNAARDERGAPTAESGKAMARSLLAKISEWKTRKVQPNEAALTAMSGHEREFARAYYLYNNALREADALDFDDLLLRAVEVLERKPLRERCLARWTHLLVDEYQDTNGPQYELTHLLTGSDENVCIVGDPDQSIYGWRGATAGNINVFRRDFPACRVVRLEENYRSSGAIVATADRLIKRNAGRPAKSMWTNRPQGTPVMIHQTLDDIDEASRVLKIARRAGDGPRRTAVLYRMNSQSRTIEDALRRGGMRYHIVGNVRFHERREIKDALSYLKAVNNPHDDISLMRIANVPPRGIGKKTLELLSSGQTEEAPESDTLWDSEPADTHLSLWNRIGQAAVGRLIVGNPARRRLGQLHALLTRLRRQVRGQGVSDAVRMIITESGYLHWLRTENSDEAEDRVGNLMEFVAAAEDYEHDDADASLAEFVDRQSLLSEADEGDGPLDAQVWLMTLHAAKGLEFPTVIITGLEERLLPHSRATNNETELEEERRLCYVGITRAESHLHLMHARRRRLHGHYEDREPSRFLHEIGGQDEADEATEPW